MPLATARKNFPAENTQRYLSRPKPTGAAVPIEEKVHSTKNVQFVNIKTRVEYRNYCVVHN